jgi:hypothetical protein
LRRSAQNAGQLSAPADGLELRNDNGDGAGGQRHHAFDGDALEQFEPAEIEQQQHRRYEREFDDAHAAPVGDQAATPG